MVCTNGQDDFLGGFLLHSLPMMENWCICLRLPFCKQLIERKKLWKVIGHNFVSAIGKYESLFGGCADRFYLLLPLHLLLGLLKGNRRSSSTVLSHLKGSRQITQQQGEKHSRLTAKSLWLQFLSLHVSGWVLFTYCDITAETVNVRGRGCSYVLVLQ